MWDSGSPRALGTRLGTFDSCHPDHFNNEVFMKKQKLFRPRVIKDLKSSKKEIEAGISIVLNDLFGMGD